MYVKIASGKVSTVYNSGAASANSSYNNGFAYDTSGKLQVDTAAVPTTKSFSNGIARHSDGVLCVNTHDPSLVSYAYLPGVASNNFSTTPVTLTDFDVQAYIASDDWTIVDNQAILSNGVAGANESLLFYINNTTGVIGTYIFNALDLTSSSAPSFSNGVGMWWRARFVNDTGSGQYSMKYYTSTDGPSTVSPSWIQLGTERTGASGTPTTPVTSLKIGDRSNGTQPFAGKIVSVKLYDGPVDTTGTLVRDFNAADFSETVTNGATAVATTGETYTLNNTGANKAMILAPARGQGGLLTDNNGALYVSTSGAVSSAINGIPTTAKGAVAVSAVT